MSCRVLPTCRGEDARLGFGARPALPRSARMCQGQRCQQLVPPRFTPRPVLTPPPPLPPLPPQPSRRRSASSPSAPTASRRTVPSRVPTTPTALTTARSSATPSASPRSKQARAPRSAARPRPWRQRARAARPASSFVPARPGPALCGPARRTAVLPIPAIMNYLLPPFKPLTATSRTLHPDPARTHWLVRQAAHTPLHPVTSHSQNRCSTAATHCSLAAGWQRALVWGAV